MSRAFETPADDMNNVLDLNSNEDADVALSDYVELYQLMSLEKAMGESKDGSIGKLASSLVKQEIQYLKKAIQQIGQNEKLQRRYGTGLAGAKKLAKASFAAYNELKAKNDLFDMIDDDDGKIITKKGGAFDNDVPAE